jgi:TonB family protein
MISDREKSLAQQNEERQAATKARLADEQARRTAEINKEAADRRGEIEARQRERTEKQRLLAENMKQQAATEMRSQTMTLTAKTELPVDMDPYVADLRSRITAVWPGNIPVEVKSQVSEPAHVVIEFTILSNGKPGDIKLVSSSGNVELDKAAWDAVARLGPSEKFPAGVTPHDWKLRVGFKYDPTSGGTLY